MLLSAQVGERTLAQVGTYEEVFPPPAHCAGFCHALPVSARRKGEGAVYRDSLSAAERAALPDNPAGALGPPVAAGRK